MPAARQGTRGLLHRSKISRQQVPLPGATAPLDEARSQNGYYAAKPGLPKLVLHALERTRSSAMEGKTRPLRPSPSCACSDLGHAKAAVLNRLTSLDAQRGCHRSIEMVPRTSSQDSPLSLTRPVVCKSFFFAHDSNRAFSLASSPSPTVSSRPSKSVPLLSTERFRRRAQKDKSF